MKNLFTAIIVLLGLGASSLIAAAPTISGLSVEVKKHDDGTQYVIVNYSITNVPSDGIVVDFEATCSKDSSGFADFVAKPIDSEISGDVGLVTTDGKKSIQWEDEAYLIRVNKQDKFRCKIKLSMQGADNTISAATLNIQSYESAAWNYFNTGLVRMTVEKKTGLEPEFSCSQLGSNWADVAKQQGATFYKITSVTDFPLYKGRNPSDKFRGAVSNTGCSSFLAIRDYGKSTQKLWANFTKRFIQTQDVNGTNITQDFEFQFRYASTKQSGSSLVVGNAGKQGQQVFSQLNTGDKMDFTLEVGKLGEVESNSFDIEVPRREWKYYYKGKHIFTVKIPAKEGSFQGSDLGNTITLKDANEVTIGSALRFTGALFEIDTTPDNCSIRFGGQMKANGVMVMNTDLNLTSATLKLNDSLVFSTFISPVQALSLMGGFSIGMERLRLTGDPNAPDGSLFDIRIVVRDLTAGCDPLLWQAGTGGILLRDVAVNAGGDWQLPASLQINNIGLRSSPDWCMKNLIVGYDKASDKFLFDCLAKTPLFADIGYGMTTIHGSLESAKLTIKSATGICPVPIPEPPPLHVAVWRGVKLEVSNLVTGPKTMKGTVFFANRDDWASVANLFNFGSREVQALTGWSIFELDAGLSGNELGEFIADGKLRVFGKSDIWVCQFRGSYSVSLNPNKIGMGIGAGFDMVQLGGDKWFFSGDAKGSMTVYPSFVASVSARGDVYLPDLFKNHPLFQMINSKLGLPLRLTTVQLMQRNTQVACDLDFGWLGTWSMWVDVSKNPFSQTTQFIGVQSGSVENLSQIAFHDKKNGIQVLDTTYVPFTTKAARTAYAQINAGSKAQSFLVSPSQKVYTGTTADSSVIFSPAANSSDVGLWVLRLPEDGKWKLGLISKQNGDSVNIWQFSKPKADFSYTATNVGRNLYCTWDSKSASDSSFIEFYLDTDSSGYNGYRIGSVLEKSGSYSFTLSDSLLECGYYIYAQRWDGDRASSFVYSPNYFANPKAALAAPLNRSGSYNLKNVVNLKWTSSPDKNTRFYIIHARNAQGLDSAIATVEPQLTEFSFSIDNPGSYQYSIQAYGSNLASGCPAVFSSVVLAVDDERSELSLSDEISASPNPTSQHITLRYRTDGSFEHSDIIIVNSLGQRVCEYHNAEQGAGAHELRLDVSALPSDLYFVHLNKNNRIMSTRFSVIR